MSRHDVTYITYIQITCHHNEEEGYNDELHMANIYILPCCTYVIDVEGSFDNSDSSGK